MNRNSTAALLTIFLPILMGLIGASQVSAGGMPSSPITYQGQLKNAGSPHTGTVNMTLSVWDQLSDGNQLAMFDQAVDVEAGLFQVEPVFASMSLTWDGPRYLQIEVDGVALTPRQLITAAPTALYALSSADGSPWQVNNGDLYVITPNIGLGTPNTPERLNVVGNIALTGWLGHRLPAGTPLPFVVSDQTAMRYVSGTDAPNILGGYFQNSMSSGGSGNVIAGGGQAGSFNSVTGSFSAIGGGSSNSIDGELSAIAGGFQNLISSDSSQATIGGGFANNVSADFGTVSGGWSNGVFAEYGTVAGGQVNIVWDTATHSMVGGGENNWIQQSGVNLGRWSAIGAGSGNRVSANRGFIGAGEDNGNNGASSFVGAGQGNETSAGRAAVVAGLNNLASGTDSFVGGGSSNEAIASNAMIPGGSENIASGQRSFAAGRRAQALHNGAFVWADSSTTTVQSSTSDQFTVQASGGARFFSNSSLTTGVQLAANGGSWSSLSDRHAKKDFQPVDVREVLDQVAALPISTWRYHEQDEATLHMGPVAQDFHAAFGLGGDQLRIATIDADGVALAAIQGLYLNLMERDARVTALEAELARLREHTEDRIALLESRLLEFRQVTMERAP